MLDLAQGMFWKAEREEESLCSAHWSPGGDLGIALFPGMTPVICKGFFSGFNFKDTGSAKGIPDPPMMLSALLGL